jgi:hypothetical protein
VVAGGGADVDTGVQRDQHDQPGAEALLEPQVAVAPDLPVGVGAVLRSQADDKDQRRGDARGREDAEDAEQQHLGADDGAVDLVDVDRPEPQDVGADVDEREERVEQGREDDQGRDEASREALPPG